jgi:hypothetical protein
MTRGLTRAELLKRLVHVHKRVSADISAQRGNDSFYGAGLASEGYAGGYLAALNDIEAMLRHGQPNDTRGYWKDPK